ncbi:MAG: hypothetical protein BWY97_01514 [Tenericutes bacterium ADurb.BinA124]|mgnify:FL=1|nr:MAG: hypothetical protein BWY97_01514 [Tenericutes bacterium ADurb.BinA124]
MHNFNSTSPSYTRQDLTTQAGRDAYQAYLTASGKKEWFQQVNLLEAYFLANDPATIKVDATSKAITNVSGVTIGDKGYSKLAAEALALAKAGKVQVVKATGANIVWVTAQVNADGKFASILVDTLDGRVTAGKFAWNEKSKQELGYLYGLHNFNDATANYTRQDLTTEAGLNAYKAYLKATGKKEWFEQVNLLSDYVQANGWNGKIVTSKTGNLDTSASATTLAGVTLGVSDYTELLEQLVNFFK